MTDLIFSNEQLDVPNLPKSADLNFVPLEKEYLNVSLITTGIFCFIILVGATVGYMQTADLLPEWRRLVILAMPILMSTLFMFLAYKGFAYKAYALREKDIVYKSGYIFRRKTIVPFNRVQHCEVNRGPIDRMFGLSELKIYTAGGSSSDMKIPGLKPESANTLKQFIAGKTTDGRSEEE